MHEAILQILSNYLTNALLWYAWTKKVNLVHLLESIAQITAIFFICFQFQGSLSTLDMVTLQDCWLLEGCSEAAKSLELTLRMKTQTQRSTRRQNPSQYQLLNSQVLVCLFFCISILFSPLMKQYICWPFCRNEKYTTQVYGVLKTTT